MYQQEKETSFVVTIADNAVRFATRLGIHFFSTSVMDNYLRDTFMKTKKIFSDIYEISENIFLFM